MKSTRKTKKEENLVRLVYTTPENELTRKQKAQRKRVDTLINQAVKQFLEGPEATMDGLVEIELYPCPDDCAHCKAA
jgi:hypothetical protein